jgi:hypothetical protein
MLIKYYDMTRIIRKKKAQRVFLITKFFSFFKFTQYRFMITFHMKSTQMTNREVE